MSKFFLKRSIAYLILGVLLTSVSYFYTRSGSQFICAPVIPGPLDELFASSRVERGFPYVYYKDRAPNTICLPSAEADNDIDYNAKFVTTAFLTNVAIWSVVISAMGEVGRYAFRRNKK